MTRNYCTYLDHRYLAKGLALYRSLEEHGGHFRLFVLCLSPEAHVALSELALARAQLISLADLEAADPAFLATKSTRETVEYYFTSTPVLMRHILEREPDVDLLTYLDADVAFFSSPEALFDEIGGHSIAIVPHRFPEKLRHLERYGRYNVAWVAFRRDANGRACLEWWRERCLEWCFDREEEGKFADQKYLDEWPPRFPGTRVLEHPGADLAPWNLESHSLTAGPAGVLVDGRPLVFFHAHRFHHERAGHYEIDLDGYDVRPSALMSQAVLEPYARRLALAAAEISDLRTRLGGPGMAGLSGVTVRASNLLSLRRSLRESEAALAEERAIRAEVERRLAASEADLVAREEELASVSTQLETARAGLRELDNELGTARKDVERQAAERSGAIAALDRELRIIRGSWSWRVTAPLRHLASWFGLAGAALPSTGDPAAAGEPEHESRPVSARLRRDGTAAEPRNQHGFHADDRGDPSVPQ